MIRVHTVTAAEVERGDYVSNHGIVDAITTVGAFVVLLIRGTTWTLGNGKGDITFRDLVLHGASDVVLETP